jgi:hypothetical protein
MAYSTAELPLWLRATSINVLQRTIVLALGLDPIDTGRAYRGTANWQSVIITTVFLLG